MSTARRSAPAQPWIGHDDHAGRPLVVDVRSLPPLPVSAPVPRPPVESAAPVAVPEPLLSRGGDEADGYREPTFDELVHGYGRHRGSGGATGPSPSRGARRASGRRW